MNTVSIVDFFFVFSLYQTIVLLFIFSRINIPLDKKIFSLFLAAGAALMIYIHYFYFKSIIQEHIAYALTYAAVLLQMISLHLLCLGKKTSVFEKRISSLIIFLVIIASAWKIFMTVFHGKSPLFPGPLFVYSVFAAFAFFRYRLRLCAFLAEKNSKTGCRLINISDVIMLFLYIIYLDVFFILVFHSYAVIIFLIFVFFQMAMLLRMERIFFISGFTDILPGRLLKKGISFNSLTLFTYFPLFVSLTIFFLVFREPYLSRTIDSVMKLLFITGLLFFNQRRFSLKISSYFSYLETKLSSFPEKTRIQLDYDLDLIPFRQINRRFLNMTRKIATYIKMHQTRIRRAIGEIEKDKSKATEYEILKKDFIANISHELKTPLTNIMGYFQLLMKKTVSEETKLESEKIIQANIDALHTLINNLLSMTSRESPGEKDIKHVDLENEIRRIISFHKNFYEMKNLKIILNVAEECKNIYTDSIRLINIIDNLISNSLKYTDSGTITVRGDIVKKNLSSKKIDLFTHNWMNYMCDTMLKLSIKDTGIGIPKNKIKSIFEPFRQEKQDINRKYGGGLGLFIVRQSLQLMNGEIEIESKVRGGTRITVYIPAAVKKI